MTNKKEGAMLGVVWALIWRLAFVMGYPMLVALRSAQAVQIDIMTGAPSAGVADRAIDVFENLAQTHSTSLIVGACIACWLMGSIIGAMYPTPDDLRATEIRPWLRFLVCLSGGFAAFLWVLHDTGDLNLLTPLWVGGVAFVAPHLIQIVPTLIKARLGLGGDK